MRVPIGCFILMAVCFVAAQTSQEFHSKYGDPDIERFTVRPGIGLTVEFGSDGLACQELLEPLQPLLQPILRRELQVSFMSSDTVTEVLEELVPLTSRGDQIRSVLTKSGCNEIGITDYVNVSIMRSTNNCQPLKPEKREMEATATFKRAACRSLRK